MCPRLGGVCLWRPHLLPRGGLVPRPLSQLLAVLQGGQQPHGPLLGEGQLPPVLHTQAALGVSDRRPCGSTRISSKAHGRKGGTGPSQQRSGSARHFGHRAKRWEHPRPLPCRGPQPQPCPSRVPQANAPAGLCLRLGTCTSRLLAFLAKRGPGGTATATAPSPSPRLGAARIGAGAGIWTVPGRLESRTDPPLGWGARVRPAGQ